MSLLRGEEGRRRGAAGAGSPDVTVPGEKRMWAAAGAYEEFMGRWSRRVADGFLRALAVPPGAVWLDVGCGVGSLTDVVARRSAPAAVVGVDPSAEFLEVARTAMRHVAPARFVRARAERLPLPDAVFDVAVSGLALNFLADPAGGLGEMVRVTRPGGTVAAYVWDYDHPDFFLTRFWAAAATDGVRVPADERGRWRLCSPAGLAELAADSPLLAPRVWTVTVEMTYPDAAALWDGFLLGVGPSGAWATALSPAERQRVRARFEAALPTSLDGSVTLTARALAVVGSVL